MPIQAAGASNRPISLQPFGRWSLRAVCCVAALVDSRAIHCAPRLASHPAKTAARPLGDRQHVLRASSAAPHHPSLGTTLDFRQPRPDILKMKHVAAHTSASCAAQGFGSPCCPPRPPPPPTVWHLTPSAPRRCAVARNRTTTCCARPGPCCNSSPARLRACTTSPC